MEQVRPGTHTIEISDEAYKVLTRTAASRNTDVAEAVDYLLEAPAAPAASSDEDDD